MLMIAAQGRSIQRRAIRVVSLINMTCGPTGRCGNTVVLIGRVVVRSPKCTTTVAIVSHSTLAISTARRSEASSTDHRPRWLRSGSSTGCGFVESFQKLP